MFLRSITIAAASLALLLLSQGNANAGFLVEHGDAWHAVGDNVGSGPTAPDSNDRQKSEPAGLTELLSQYLTQDAAQFGRIGCSTRGGMSSSSSDNVSQSGSVFLIVSRVSLAGAQGAMWLHREGAPRLPPRLATMILQPPRA